MKNGNILILNGASSSGKSSILQVLQTIMEEPYLNAGIDKFIWMLPKRYLDRPLWDEVMGLEDRAGQVGQALMHGMHVSIASMSACGNHVIADHVMVDPGWLRDCAGLFAGLPAYLIGIRCPLEILEERERNRKDRTLGQARMQDAVIHTHGFYDLEVDTSRNDPTACAYLIKEYITTGAQPCAFQKLREAAK